MWLFILLILVILWTPLFRHSCMFCWYWLKCDHHCLNFLTFWFTCALSRHTVMLHWLHLPFDILEQCGVSFGTSINVPRHNNRHQTCNHQIHKPHSSASKNIQKNDMIVILHVYLFCRFPFIWHKETSDWQTYVSMFILYLVTYYYN